MLKSIDNKEIAMLTLESQTVYDAISLIAGEEEVYKVVEADEIITRLPSTISLDKVRLASIIRELKDRGYIHVKYFTPDEYCLALVKRLETPQKSSQMQSAEVEVALPVPVTRRRDVSMSRAGAFFSALIGSILGSGIVATITALIIKFVL